MKKYVTYGLALAVVWVFIRGSPSVQTLVQGLFFGMPVSFAFRRFYPGEFSLSLGKMPFVLEYIAIFIESLIISNLSVAHSLLRPSKTVNPDIIKYKSNLENPTALAILADSITLTPGTLVVDHLRDENKLLIHCLNSNCAEETRKDIHRLEKILQRCTCGKK